MSHTGPFGSGAFGTGVFSNTPFYSTKDLIDAILRDSGHSNPSTETVKRQVALAAINNRYAMVTTKRHWAWLYSAVDMNFVAPYDTGTVLVTKGSSSVIGTSTDWTSQDFVPGWRMVVNSGRREAYTVLDVTSDTTIDLDSVYSSETTDEASYQLIKSIYELPADLDQVHAVLVHGVGKLELIGPQEMRRKQASDPGLTGKPCWATVVGVRAQDGVKSLEVYPTPDDRYQVTVDYGVAVMALGDDEDNYPLIPDRHRQCLYYGGMADMQRYMKDLSAAADLERLFSQSVLNMMNDRQLTDSRLRYKPKTAVSRIRKRPYRGLKYAVDDTDFSRGGG